MSCSEMGWISHRELRRMVTFLPMGIQDRDYYRDWWAKREGKAERAEAVSEPAPKAKRVKQRKPWPAFALWVWGICLFFWWLFWIMKIIIATR